MGMIDPNKAIAILEQFQTYVFGDPSYGGMVTVPEIIELLKEQEPKIGHWILDPDGMDWNIPAWRCSECGNRHIGLPTMDCDETNIYLFAGSRFCPNCGAKMERR